MTGLSKKIIQRAEKGEKINVESLKSIASVYEIDFNDLYISERKKEVPKGISLSIIKNGNHLSKIVNEKDGYDFDFVDINEPELIQLISEIFENLKEYGECWDMMEFSDKGNAIIEFNDYIKKLENNNLLVFGGTRRSKLLNKFVKMEPMDVEISMIRVLKMGNPLISKIKEKDSDINVGLN